MEGRMDTVFVKKHRSSFLLNAGLAYGKPVLVSQAALELNLVWVLRLAHSYY